MSCIDESGGETRCQRQHAVFRLVLGQLQIMGATAGLVLLLNTRVTRQTIIVVGTSLVMSIASRIIFWSRRPADQREQTASRLGTEEHKNYGNAHRH
jgi:hypothetical protein